MHDSKNLDMLSIFFAALKFLAYHILERLEGVKGVNRNFTCIGLVRLVSNSWSSTSLHQVIVVSLVS